MSRLPGGDFQAQVDNWIRKSENLLHGVAQESVQRVVRDMMVPRGRGGNFPVDTGFMRSSVTAEIGQMPRGNGDPNNGPAGGGEGQVTATLLRWRMGQTLYVGIVANYALYMEERYAFLRLAAQKWNQTVRQVTEEMRRRAGR